MSDFSGNISDIVHQKTIISHIAAQTQCTYLQQTLKILIHEQNKVPYFTYVIIHIASQRHLYTFCFTLHVLQVTLQHHLNLQ